MIENTEVLTSIEIDAAIPAKKSVIVLHGLGADGNDFVPIVPELQLPKEAGVRFIFPHAPVRPITINNGYEMRAWYDISSFSFDRNIDKESIALSIAQVGKLIANEIACGIDPANIILAGFSQGAVIALLTGLSFPNKLAGMIALSGYLPAPQEVLQDASKANNQTPIFVGHGTFDPIVPFSLGKKAAEALRQAGYPVTWHEYPIPHSVSSEEINDIAAWMRKIFQL